MITLLLCILPVTGIAQDKSIGALVDGYRGIWYMNQPTKDEYAYKYSGGLGTYTANHVPMAVRNM